jgi:hypothetical protein
VVLVGEEGRLVEGGGGKSLLVGVGARAIRVPFLADVCFTLLLLLLVKLILFFPPLIVLILSFSLSRHCAIK